MRYTQLLVLLIAVVGCTKPNPLYDPNWGKGVTPEVTLEVDGGAEGEGEGEEEGETIIPAEGEGEGEGGVVVPAEGEGEVILPAEGEGEVDLPAEGEGEGEGEETELSRCVNAQHDICVLLSWEPEPGHTPEDSDFAAGADLDLYLYIPHPDCERAFGSAPHNSYTCGDPAATPVGDPDAVRWECTAYNGPQQRSTPWGATLVDDISEGSEPEIIYVDNPSPDYNTLVVGLAYSRFFDQFGPKDALVEVYLKGQGRVLTKWFTLDQDEEFIQAATLNRPDADSAWVVLTGEEAEAQ